MNLSIIVFYAEPKSLSLVQITVLDYANLVLNLNMGSTKKAKDIVKNAESQLAMEVKSLDVRYAHEKANAILITEIHRRGGGNDIPIGKVGQ